MISARRAGKTRMMELLKIAIIHRDQAPQFLLETPAQGIPWTVESFPESTILSGSLIPSRDYLAVFIPERKWSDTEIRTSPRMKT
jgi:hypothetical protein